MPGALLVQSANAMLTAESAPRLVNEFPEAVEELSKPGTLVAVAAKVLKLDKSDRDYLRAIPTAIQEAIRATIYDAMSSGKSVQVQYAPGYDYALAVSDYGEAVSIHLTGPYLPGRPKDFAAGVRRARASTTGLRARQPAKKLSKRAPAKRGGSKAR